MIRSRSNRVGLGGLWLIGCGIGLLLVAGTAAAQCLAVVDPETELPHRRYTPGGVAVSYHYDLATEQYTVELGEPGQQAGPYGPYVLTRACEPALLKWENAAFVLLEAGCGTFCWYVLILPTSPGSTTASRVERPLAFDAARGLLAYYADQDLIRVRHLASGREQDIHTTLACEYYSGLCFEGTRFVGDTLEVTWRDNPAGQVFRMPLDPTLTE